MADIPAPRTALPLRPPERLRLLREDAGWNLGLRFRRLWLAQPRARRAVIARVHEARGYDWPDDLEALVVALGHKLRAGRLSPALLAEAFALIDHALHRSFGFRYHDVQLDAGILLAAGYFVEMATGEGKTFTGILPGALHALAGCAVHVVTVNDYLAERDAAEVAPVYQCLGLSVGHVLHDMKPDEKRATYLESVVYCANKELVFDYLRDRAKEPEASPLAYRLRLAEGQGPVVRDLDFVLIDEADSVLIDEANIPLILTEPREDTLSVCFLKQATELALSADKSVWETPDALGYRSIRIERLQELIAQLDDPAPEWNSLAIAEEMLVQAKTAEERFKCDVHYIVDNRRIVLIDQQTGRPTPDRSLPWGLQQLIELREGLEPSPSRSVIGKQSFQTYFRKYHKMVGMSGTLREVRRELARTFGVPFAAVRTHRPVQRFRDQRRLFTTTESKLSWVIGRTRAICASGRAVLIGVSSVALSEEVSAALARGGLTHGILNARRLAEEAEIIGEAGRTGRITVVTNMAGRGTDIKLASEVRAAGGLHVIIFDVLETDRLDRQLFGRSGRQGDSGSYDIAHSLDEPALERLLGKRAHAVMGLVLSLPEELRIIGYFGLLNFRRRWLERIRRKRRLKLILGEEKRDDFLAFTRRS